MLDVATDDRALDAVANQPALPAHAVLLLTALAAGVVAQGGYYLPGRVLVTVLVLAAAAVALRVKGFTRADIGPAVAAGALALWILARAVQVDE